MVMDTIQIRLSQGLIQKVDELIQTGIYSNRSDVIRDAVRKLILDDILGIISSKKNSVKEVREIRQKLSSQIKSFKDVEKINRLID
ncbi:MAG: ribbon-helix-helix domain-containing protein [Candidatus Nanoarchaeia archaeon]|nr:ribbon-helix-helix domain-containing protein [Candidatus Nanoarchaeia archaeon]